jgi:hypothetical protein
MYCIKSKLALGSYVERLVFNDCGISIDFTVDEGKAARIQQKEIAEHLAKTLSGCTVVKHSGKKPDPPESDIKVTT